MKKLLSVIELSKILNIPVATIYYKVHRRELPFIKIGRHLRFDLDEVIKFFREETSKNDSCAKFEFDIGDGSGSLKLELTDLLYWR